MSITFQKNSLRASTVVELVISLAIVGAGVVVLASALTDNVKMFKYRENRHTAQITAENVVAVVSSLDVEDFDCLLRGAPDYDVLYNKKNFDPANQAWLNDWIQDPVENIEFDISLFDANNNPVTGMNHPNLGAVAKHTRILNTTVTYKINPNRPLVSTFTSSTRMPPLDRLNGSRQNSWRALRSTCSPALPVPTNVPSARRGIFTAVWTGKEAIVWGGNNMTFTRLSSGGRYNPTTDTWAPVATPPNLGDIPGRDEHYAAWTGDRMIVWGGTRNDSNNFTDTGGLYNPVDDTWSPISSSGAPRGRCCFAGAWTGSTGPHANRLIVWGGMGRAPIGSALVHLNDGGVYTRATNSWEALPLGPVGFPKLMNTSGVWTGSTGPFPNRFIVWGGSRPPSAAAGELPGVYYSQRGLVFDLNTTPISVSETNLAGAPSARDDHLTVWTGSELLVWGGYDSTSSLNTGGLYNPATNTWRATTLDNAPSPRGSMAANSQMQGIWTGKYLLIWGGENASSIHTDGGWYDPATNEWNTVYNPFLNTWGVGVDLATKRRLFGSNTLSGLTISGGVWMDNEAFFFGGGTNSTNGMSNTYGIFAP